jgi:hypothetical protein
VDGFVLLHAMSQTLRGSQGDSQRLRQVPVCDRTAGVDLGKHPCRALLCRHRAAIDEVITIINPITLTITIITLREKGVRWDRDAYDNTELAPVRLGVAVLESGADAFVARSEDLHQVQLAQDADDGSVADPADATPAAAARHEF